MLVHRVSLGTALELCGILKSQFIEMWSSSEDVQYVNVEKLHRRGVLNHSVYGIKPKFETLGGGGYVCMSFKVDKHTMERVCGK